MDTKNLVIGEKLSIEILNNAEEKRGLVYSSQLIDMIDSENIVISCPIYKSRYIMLENDSRVRIQYNDQGEYVKTFMANIISKEMKDNVLSLNVKIVSPAEKVQRRKFYRFNCCLDVKYYWQLDASTIEDELGLVTRSTYKKAITRNLSGNGACIITDEELHFGTGIQVVIFNSGVPFKLKSTVIRSDRIMGIDLVKYESGIFFSDISTGYQEKVVKFIFNEQREMLSRA